MFKWNERNQEKWLTTRIRGKSHFVWVRGVLAYGGIMFVFFTIFQHIMASKYEGVNVADASISIILINAVIWTVGGYMWGTGAWNLSERKFKEYNDRNL